MFWGTNVKNVVILMTLVLKGHSAFDVMGERGIWYIVKCIPYEHYFPLYSIKCNLEDRDEIPMFLSKYMQHIVMITSHSYCYIH